jgi:hypothetical protein
MHMLRRTNLLEIGWRLVLLEMKYDEFICSTSGTTIANEVLK